MAPKILWGVFQVVKLSLKRGLRTNLCPDPRTPSARGEQAGLRGKPNPMGPAKKAAYAWCGQKRDGEQAEAGYRGPDPRDLHVNSWGDSQGTLAE